jgi:hypothetical protein
VSSSEVLASVATVDARLTGIVNPPVLNEPEEELFDAAAWM